MRRAVVVQFDRLNCAPPVASLREQTGGKMRGRSMAVVKSI